MFKAVQNLREQKAFTLIELLIVVAIIGILAAIAIPAYIGAQEKARKSTLIKAAASAESDLQHWMNSAIKGMASGTPGAGLIEVDTNWDGQITAAGDDPNSTITNSYSKASWAAIDAYENARIATADETSPWIGMDKCLSTGVDGTGALFIAVSAASTGGTFCNITLYGGTAGSTITIVGNSNGPGGSASDDFENLHTKTVGSE